MTLIVTLPIALIVSGIGFSAYASDSSEEARVAAAAQEYCKYVSTIAPLFKGGYVVPHMFYPGETSKTAKNVQNHAAQAIKIQITMVNKLQQFNLNAVVGLIKNDNSELTLRYKGPWIRLKNCESITLITPIALIDTAALSEQPTYNQQSVLKIRARIADKTQRATIKNKFKIFDVSDMLPQNHFTVDIHGKNIKINRKD